MGYDREEEGEKVLEIFILLLTILHFLEDVSDGEIV